MPEPSGVPTLGLIAPPGARPSRARVATVALLALAAFVIAAGIDLFGPRRVDIRAFDSREVARLDTEMWRSYYDKKPVALFFQLAELMRRQFHFPLLRSYVAAFYAAKAAFVFKGGHARPDYEKALPDIERYYASIARLSTTRFDVKRTSQKELEWWIVHRERQRHPPGDLEGTLADAASELYRVPIGSLSDYGFWRARAMTIRDSMEEHGGVREQDWRTIDDELQTSWLALWSAVQRQRPS